MPSKKRDKKMPDATNGSKSANDVQLDPTAENTAEPVTDTPAQPNGGALVEKKVLDAAKDPGGDTPPSPPVRHQDGRVFPFVGHPQPPARPLTPVSR